MALIATSRQMIVKRFADFKLCYENLTPVRENMIK